MKKNKHGDENGKCVLDEEKICDDCGECDMCDLDPSKICDNCGACIDQYNTNEKGYIDIPIDKIDMTGAEPSLDDFYEMMGLKEEEDDDDDK